MTHAWSMYLGLSGVRWPLAKTHLPVFMIIYTSKNPGVRWQQLIRNYFSRCWTFVVVISYLKDIERTLLVAKIWILEVRVLTPKVHISKNRGFARGQMTPGSPRYINQACAIYCFVARCHTLCSAKRDLRYLSLRVRTGPLRKNDYRNINA